MTSRYLARVASSTSTRRLLAVAAAAATHRGRHGLTSPANGGAHVEGNISLNEQLLKDGVHITVVTCRRLDVAIGPVDGDERLGRLLTDRSAPPFLRLIGHDDNGWGQTLAPVGEAVVDVTVAHATLFVVDNDVRHG